jgi:hypothetical protein
MYAQIFSTLVDQCQSILNKYSFGNNLKDIKEMINKTKVCSFNEHEIINLIDIQTQINKLKNENMRLIEDIKEIKDEMGFSYSRILRARIRSIETIIYDIDEQIKDCIMDYAIIINDNFPLLHFHNYKPSYTPKNVLDILYERCALEISRPVLRTMFHLGLIDESEYLESKRSLKKRVKKYFIKEKRNIKKTINLLKNKVCYDVIYNCILPYM